MNENFASTCLTFNFLNTFSIFGVFFVITLIIGASITWHSLIKVKNITFGNTNFKLIKSRKCYSISYQWILYSESKAIHISFLYKLVYEGVSQVSINFTILFSH